MRPHIQVTITFKLLGAQSEVEKHGGKIEEQLPEILTSAGAGHVGRVVRLILKGIGQVPVFNLNRWRAKNFGLEPNRTSAQMPLLVCVGYTKTKTYLADLQKVAKMSGQEFAEILHELMGQINEAVIELRPASAQSTTEKPVTAPDHKMAADSDIQPKMAADPVTSTNMTAASSPLPKTQPAAATGQSINISAAELNPPEVQRYVVEHIVKSDDMRSSHRLRTFSGRVPRPQHEVDFDTWRAGVDLILRDAAISEFQRSRYILDSLLPPAADVVKHLSSDLPAEIYIQHLESAYGTVQDREELYVKFMDTLQDSGEKPSAYLHRLQVALSLAVKRGGVKQSDFNRHLLSQFCRGCWDNTLISELQLKQRKSNPPPFSELLTLLRTEEDREANKAQRMKQHLGTSKQRVTAQAQYAVEEDGVCAALSSLTKQVAEIQRQLAALTASKSAQTHQSSPPVPKLHPRPKTSSPKPGFCFRCGEDGHIKPQCENRPNPALCLLDTGSQVTTVPVSFYNRHLHEQPIHPLHDLLQVEGAAGHNVPYLGYVEITVQFPIDFIGKEHDISTLALVVPDTHPDLQSTILIGMNTLEPLYERYIGELSTFQPSAHGYRAVLKTLQLSHQQKEEGNIGVVRLLGKAPVRVPAGRTIVIEGSAKVSSPPSSQNVLLQHPASALPGGLCVSSCLISLPALPPYKVPVIISNESEQDTFIPPYSVIADLEAYHCVLSEHRVTHPTVERPSSSVNIEFGDSPLSPEWKKRVTEKLNAVSEVFSKHDLDFGRTTAVKHHIPLHDSTPFKQRARPIHPQDIEAVRRHLRELLEAGVIRESSSPFSSPVVVVRKKNGEVRLCIDYRKLNLQTVKDAYALPNLEESFSALSGSKWFSVLDLKSGYYQIEMSEEDKPKTAFVTPLGFWEFNRMPQGVTNAPSTFQRLMERCMGDLHLKEVLVFLDDLIIFSDSLEEHERRLLRVLDRLRQYGLKLSPEKCRFFQTSVRYLGHIVSEQGVETDPEKIETIKAWPIPTTLKQLRSFLGFAGYYRRFIKDYAIIAKPLNNLTRGYAPAGKAKKSTPHKTPTYSPNQPFGERWSPSCQLAFESLIEKLTTAPVLGFADSSQPYILHTDASVTGLGAALYQEQEGKLRVIAYASLGLSQSESHYPAHKLEFLALKWAVTEKFQDYLYGAEFTVVTDSNPLTYILTTAKLDATGHRWLAALSTYSFKLLYRAGKQNIDADALSRRPHLRSSDETPNDAELIHQFISQHTVDSDAISEEIVDAICQCHLVRASSPEDLAQIHLTLIESLSINADTVPDSYSSEDLHQLPLIQTLDIREKQHSDPCLRELIHQLQTGEKIPPTARAELPELPLLLREWSKLELVDGILYRRRRDNEELSYQLVLPEDLRPLVLQSLHDNMGHMGIDRTLDLVRTRFYWPKMALDVEQKIKTCGRCVRRKALPERAAQLVSITTSRPLELLCMDFLSLEPDTSNTQNILVLTDHFTKFAIAIPTPNQNAKTVAKTLWENFITYYGIPERIHTDQGRDFESKLIKELCEVAGIQKSRTTPYHPRGNPVERFNRTLLGMLGTLEPKQKSRWREHVKPLVHAYNCTRNEVTGFTPYELMFGRTPRLPVDIAFGLPLHETQQKNHSQYVETLKSRLQESFKIAAKNSIKSTDRNKARFDSRVIPSALVPGDRVLVRNVRLRGKQKLSDKWEQEVHVVVHRAGDLPVYKVRPESGNGPTRTLHRDLLLPCAFLKDNENLQSTDNSPVRRPRTRQQTKTADSSTDIPAEEDDCQESLVNYHLNPPTVHFTVERQRPISVFDPPTENESQSSPVSDHPAGAEDQGAPTPALSSPPAPIAESSSEESDAEKRESEIVESESENQSDTLPVNLPEEILTENPVVPVEDPPEESSPVEPPDNDSDTVDLTLRRKPAYEMLECDPDWAPSLHLGHTEVKPVNAAIFDRLKARAKQLPTTSHKPGPETEEDDPGQNHEASYVPQDDSEAGESPSREQQECTMCSLKLKEIMRLQEENQRLKDELSQKGLDENFLKDNDQKKLSPGDVVLADRGFDIKESIALMGATLKIPAFTRGRSQLEAKDVEQTRKLAHVRIHVERVIGVFALNTQS
ncbi:hypothetical protein WMY93_033485 [Mugilogobius chulae]|uniref:Gypsy retrotransposon integrase-like protein 1 n=1 Tax=Mugilogobius chulae TaxID=88201 RepID=A0AAW0ML18_9GOBI